MAGAKGAKLAARALYGAPRKHYCPQCPEDESGNLAVTQAVMIVPGRKMMFRCKGGHLTPKNQTILQ